ncbi:hypothetical protein KFL_002470040 [Klebsormidium nitens]|uniref:procollagen-proline 3-dioxygenase n=1 Tax=Klebsormidium nitens TaxID=105231 RepID=A0A1Y1IAA4_KLENI|nr:hypothetical protein KFL_002470040 [Klebsormidium nitens]|eukprot:GAQ85647.1 hypothetical protein KFL_002470040 [Klebsormidium nitens]
MQRAVFEDVLSPAECQELIFILKSCGVIGYRPHVISCTPQDLIASNSAPLVLPLLNAAARVQQLVEGRFGKECELFTEFVGLISWKTGASIGWHHDSNREYLRQRHYSAVCYLNDQGTDFAGGTFRFRDGQPDSVVPLPGRVVAYSSGEENTHSVDPITRGERITLALWFTTDPDHSKDGVLLPQLQSALQRALSSAPGGSFKVAAPYPIDPFDTFFVEPEAWSCTTDLHFNASKESEGVLGTDPDAENGRDAVLQKERTGRNALVKRSRLGSPPTDDAERGRKKRARLVGGADTSLGHAFERGSEPDGSGGGVQISAQGEKDLRCERFRELGLRFALENGLGRAEGSPDALLRPKAVQSGEWRPLGNFATEAPVAAGVSWDAGNAPDVKTAENSVVGNGSPRRSGYRPSEAADGSVRLHWLDGTVFETEFRSKMHALQVLYHFVECVGETPSPTAAPLQDGKTTALNMKSVVDEGCPCKDRPPTKNLEIASLLRMRGREAMQMPDDLRSEEAICWNIREHRRGSKKSCDKQRCSDHCDLRTFLGWPKDIPLHDPQSFKKLGMVHKDIRETFVDAVYELEYQDVSAGPSPPVSSIWCLGKLVEPVHPASAGGSLHVEVPPRTLRWRVSARSGVDPDTSSSVSWWAKDGTGIEAPRLVFPVGEHDPQVQPHVGCLGTPPFHGPQSLTPFGEVYLMGGWNGTRWLGSVDRYRPSRNEWEEVAPMWAERYHAASAVLGGMVYVFGGRGCQLCYDTVERYDRASNSWANLSKMKIKRRGLGGAAVQGKIYAVGGSDSFSIFADVEMYDPAADKWLSVPPMLDERFCGAAAEMHSSLYALGGFDGQQLLPTMERFDPREGYWVRAPSMSTKRGSLSAAVYNNNLFALGGFDGDLVLNSVESYEPRMNTWKLVPPMHTQRASGASVVVDNALYFIGGVDGELDAESVERYTPEAGWQFVTTRSNSCKRSCPAVAVL